MIFLLVKAKTLSQLNTKQWME